MVLNTVGVESNVVLFVFGLAAGIAGPLVFEYVFGRYAWAIWLLFGHKPRRATFRLLKQQQPLQVADPSP